MPDGRVLFVDSVVHPAGDGVLSAVSDNQRYPRQRHSSLSGTLAPCCEDTGGDSICDIKPVQVGMWQP